MQNIEENYGYLIIEVRTANGTIPLENAVVTVSGGAENNLIYSLRTKESGETEKVKLASKPKSMSFEPGAKEPFMPYNIAVSLDGYYNAESISVPVFPGTTSIQKIDLIPLAEYGNPDSENPDFGRFIRETPENPGL